MVLKLEFHILYSPYSVLNILSCTFKTVFKIKLFFNYVLLPYVFTLLGTAGHRTRRSQANSVCLCPEAFSLVADLRNGNCALAVVAPKRSVPATSNASPWRNLPFPFSTHDRSKPPQSQIRKVTSEVWQLHACKQRNKAKISPCHRCCTHTNLSIWNSKNLTVLHLR